MTNSELRRLVTKLKCDIDMALPTGLPDRELNYVYSALIASLANDLQTWLKEDINDPTA